MSGLCGFLGSDSDESAARANLHGMTEALGSGPAEYVGERVADRYLGLAINTAAGGASLAGDTGAGSFAAIDGQPHWRDDALAGIAREHGDAAALLHAWRTHGRGLLQTLGGAFALAVVDAKRGQALLAVDRMGQRPMAYGLGADASLYFASNASALCRHPNVDARLNEQAIFDYMYFHVVPSPGTIYREIFKLAPGECLALDNGRATRETYWLPDFSPARDATTPELVDTLRHTLRGAVRRCEPDATTGSFLSGGLDSSSVTGILAEQCDTPPAAYTIGFEAAGYDEMDFARLAANHFGTPLHEYYVTPRDIVDAIPLVARAYDEPFGNSSAIPAYVCARQAREHGTVTMLAGDGGDEIFAGNERYAKQKLFEPYHGLPGWLRRGVMEPVMLSAVLSQTPGLKKLASYVRQARLPMPERTQTYNLLHRVAVAEIFTPEFLAAVDPGHPLALLDETYHRAPSEELLNRMLYMDWKFTLADNDLRKVTRTCELAGVTVKYPFLDDALVEFSTHIPSRLKLRGQKLRHFFKLASEGFLPPQVINKSKHGFGLPFGSWLREHRELQERTYQSLYALKARGYVHAAFIDRLVDEHRTGHAAFFGGFVWVFAMLEDWLQAHGH